ncbi:MAG: hypothetical protein Tsb008_22010 [Rhodothalassiaceae bacterium]
MTRYHGLGLAALLLFPALLPTAGSQPVMPVRHEMVQRAPAIPVAHTDQALLAMPDDMAVREDDLTCLAQAVYFEARSEPLEGQIAVAQVVLNRVKSEYWPDSVCAVVFQNEHRRNGCQFSFACDGRSDRPYNMVAWDKARKIARLALQSKLPDITEQATHYHADYVAPDWQNRLEETAIYGRHRFYRETEDTRRGHLLARQQS